MRILRLSFCLLSGILICGCSTPRFVLNEQSVREYLVAHPDRPADIRSKIVTGTVVQGMTKDEVTICWGKPDFITTDGKSDVVTEAWIYLEEQIIAYSHHHRTYAEVVMRSVRFQNGLVVTWHIFERGRE